MFRFQYFHVYFYSSGSNDQGHLVFVLSVCLSVCLSVVNFNLQL